MSKNIYNNNIIISCPLVHDESGYFYLVYQITNLVNGKIYIGKHTTKDPYDNYMGSGKLIIQAIKKYGLENFTKEILFCFTDEKEAFLKEEEIVTKEFIDRENTYNIIVGGKGLSSGENNPMYGKPSVTRGKHLSQEHKDKISKANKGKLVGEKNPFYGKHHDQNTRSRMSKSHTGKRLSQEHKDKISKAHKGKYTGENSWMYGNRLSQEHKDKISKAISGENHPMYGRVGKLSPRAKAVLKIDEMGNVITEYETIKECCKLEHISHSSLCKIIAEHVLHNGFYFEYKPKN